MKRFDFHKKSYDNPGSVDVFLRFFSGEVITWISYDVIRSGANNIFKSKCLLQLNDHILHVDSEIPETDIEKALCRGIYDVSVRFKKSCKIYLITDRELFHGPDYRSTNIKSELLFNALNTFEEKGCSITEIIVKDGYKLIHNQVCNPSTEIVEITDSNISAPKSTDVNEVSTELTVAENKAKTDVMDRELPPRGPNDTLKLRAEKSIGIKKTTEVINNDKVQVKKEMNQPAIPGELRLKCRVCNSMFAMSPSEVDFYKKKGFQMPQRCKACREKGVRYSNKDYYDRGIKRNSRFV